MKIDVVKSDTLGEVVINLEKRDMLFRCQYDDNLELDAIIISAYPTYEGAVAEIKMNELSYMHFDRVEPLICIWLYSSSNQLLGDKFDKNGTRLENNPNHKMHYGTMIGLSWVHIEKLYITRQTWVRAVNKGSDKNNVIKYKHFYEPKVHEYFRVIEKSDLADGINFRNWKGRQVSKWLEMNSEHPTYVLPYSDALLQRMKETQYAMQEMIEKVSAFFIQDRDQFLDRVINTPLLLSEK